MRIRPQMIKKKSARLVVLLAFIINVGGVEGRVGKTPLQIIDLTNEYEPTEEQLDFNYTVVQVREGYKCLPLRQDGSNYTLRASYTKHRIEGLRCTPAKWRAWYQNCNETLIADHLCEAGKVNISLASLKLDGSQSCEDAANAISLRYAGVTEQKTLECTAIHGRKLYDASWCTSREKSHGPYTAGSCAPCKQAVFNWWVAATSPAQTNEHQDRRLHHHAWYLHSNVKGWGNTNPSDMENTVIWCLQEYRRARFKPASYLNRYEGNILKWPTDFDHDASIHTKGRMVGQMILEPHSSNRDPSDTCARRHVLSKIHIDTAIECLVDVIWHGKQESASPDTVLPIKSGWTV